MKYWKITYLVGDMAQATIIEADIYNLGNAIVGSTANLNPIVKIEPWIVDNVRANNEDQMSQQIG